MNFSYIIIERLSSFGSDSALRRTLAFLKECGYQGVELNLTEPLGIDLSDLQKWIHDLGLSIPSFLTGEAYPDGLCLCSPDASIRRKTAERLIRYLDTARRFDAVLVVGLLQGLRSDEPDPNVANGRIADCLGQVAEAAEERNVQLVIEPVNHLQVGFNNSVAQVRQMIATIGSAAIRPMIDTIHMNIEETSLTQPILDCGAELRHVHLGESNGALFGTGHIDFGAVLEALEQIGYRGFASIKVYREGIRKGAPSAIEYLRRL